MFKAFATEFKAFAMRGNVMDLAIGVVIGAAFGKIVSALVNQIITPPLGLLLGGVNFSDLVITLRAATEETEAVVMGYGLFLQSLFDFIIIAFAIFMAVKVMNRLQRSRNVETEEPASPPAPSSEEVLLAEIRDLLRESRGRVV